MSGWDIAHLIWAYGGDLAAAISIAFAFWRGGLPEKWGAAILAIGWILSEVVDRLHLDPLRGVHYFLFANDSVALVAFLAVSLWSRRLWTVFMTAFQLNDVATHFVAMASHMNTYTYITAIGFWGGWALVFVLAWGTWDHVRRQRLAAIEPGAANA